MIGWQIRVITKLPNSEQSYKGKVKTHKYINRQNQSTVYTHKLIMAWQSDKGDSPIEGVVYPIIVHIPFY
jgi:hypothetical protein